MYFFKLMFGWEFDRLSLKNWKPKTTKKNTTCTQRPCFNSPWELSRLLFSSNATEACGNLIIKPLTTLSNPAPNKQHRQASHGNGSLSRGKQILLAHLVMPRNEGHVLRALRFARFWATLPFFVHFNLRSNSCSCRQTMARVLWKYISFCSVLSTAA